MKYIFLIFASSLLFSCAAFQPKNFTNEALNETILTTERKETSLKSVLQNNNKTKKLIQVYASYCPVSKESFPKVEVFQQQYPNIEYLFLSVDHTYHDWKRYLATLNVKGQHYYISKKGKGELAKFLKLKTIPRFIIIDESGNISTFKTSKLPTKI